MTTWTIQTGASTRSKQRQNMTHTITEGTIYRDVTVQTEEDALYVATMLHVQRVGWNASVWVKDVA